MSYFAWLLYRRREGWHRTRGWRTGRDVWCVWRTAR